MGHLLALAIGAVSLGVFVLLVGLERSRAHKAAASAPEEAPATPQPLPQPALQLKSAAPRGLREVLGAALQPLGERLYEREGKGHKAGKPSLQQKLLRAGLHLRSGEYLAIQVACIGVACAISILRFGPNPVVGVFALGAYFAPNFYVGFKQGRYQTQFSTQLPEVLMQISNALKAGISIGAAMGQVADTGRQPMAGEFSRVVKEIALGGAVEEVLQKMVRRTGNPDLELMVIAINIHRRVGGNLAEVLEGIAETIRERVKVKGEVKTLTTQARTSGYIITALPVLLTGFLAFITPTYFAPMTQSIIGWGLIGAALILLGVGNFLMRKVAEVEV